MFELGYGIVFGGRVIVLLLIVSICFVYLFGWLLFVFGLVLFLNCIVVFRRWFGLSWLISVSLVVLLLTLMLVCVTLVVVIYEPVGMFCSSVWVVFWFLYRSFCSIGIVRWLLFIVGVLVSDVNGLLVLICSVCGSGRLLLIRWFGVIVFVFMMVSDVFGALELIDVVVDVR